MTKRVGNPLPFFTDKRGLPLDGGRLYIGEVNEDPQLSPLTIYLDELCSIPIAPPLLIVGGLATNDGNPAFFYVAEDTFSMRVRDRDGGEMFYFPDAVVEETRWQPKSAALDAIAEIAATNYGRGLLALADPAALRSYVGLVATAYGQGLLSLADAAALRSYAGIVAALPLTGGTVSGSIRRENGGPFLFHANDLYASGRVFITPAGTPDPTTEVGDIWIELEP